MKTALLLGLLTGLLLLGGQALGGQQGLYIAFLMSIGMNFFSYFFSDKMALAMYSAERVSPGEHPEIYARVGPIVEALCQRMQLPMPKLWLIPEESPNAFATGRNPAHASVAFTYGVLQLMDDREIEGVIAHELGHVKHRDILISSVAATIAGAIAMIGRMAFFFGGARSSDEDHRGGAGGGLVMMIVAPIAAMLIQMAISRSREFDADAAAAKYTGSPDGLVSALQKLEGWSKRIPMDASPATAHMFIIQPFSGASMLKLFSTHPPTAERIARLEAIAV
ncbi:MAG TPA: zinc metalloprotease HtpX [Bryobacteraceae bacterium]|nr:zinc metalloprotease HtpX [Bryobacteraceae bacterium]